jgi:hypothetical protein
MIMELLALIEKSLINPSDALQPFLLILNRFGREKRKKTMEIFVNVSFDIMLEKLPHLFLRSNGGRRFDHGNLNYCLDSLS